MIKGTYYWKGDDFELTIAKRKGFIALMIKRGDDHQTAILTRKQFFSFICEVVKYVLRLPIVARRIPFYESCATSQERPHGILHAEKLRLAEDDNIWMKVYSPWLRYHGIKEGDEIIYWEEDGQLMSAPAKSKAKIIHDVPPRCLAGKGKKPLLPEWRQKCGGKSED